MNHLVCLDSCAGELEKILSGVKCMLIKTIGLENSASYPVRPGDSLFFLRDKDDCDLQVKATVVRVSLFDGELDEDLPHYLKELQPKLQLTEDQFNYWSEKQKVLLVEFEAAQKIGVIHLALDELKINSNWIAFEAFSILTSGMFQ
jgi:hypothetical protein